MYPTTLGIGHTYYFSWRNGACPCGEALSLHACMVGSATVDACGEVTTHVSGTCAAHAPRVCKTHPWDDGRDGFCGACLDDYQSGERTVTPRRVRGAGFVLVGRSYKKEN